MEWALQWVPLIALAIVVIMLIGKYDNEKVRALQAANERYRERIAEQNEEIRFLNNRLFDARYKWSGPGDSEIKPEPHFVTKAINGGLTKPRSQNKERRQ